MYNCNWLYFLLYCSVVFGTNSIYVITGMLCAMCMHGCMYMIGIHVWYVCVCYECKYVCKSESAWCANVYYVCVCVYVRERERGREWGSACSMVHTWRSENNLQELELILASHLGETRTPLFLPCPFVLQASWPVSLQADFLFLPPISQ